MAKQLLHRVHFVHSIFFLFILAENVYTMYTFYKYVIFHWLHLREIKLHSQWRNRSRTTNLERQLGLHRNVAIKIVFIFCTLLRCKSRKTCVFLFYVDKVFKGPTILSLTFFFQCLCPMAVWQVAGKFNCEQTIRMMPAK